MHMVVVFIEAESGKADENRARQVKSVQSTPMQNSVRRLNLLRQKKNPDHFKMLVIHRMAQPRTCEPIDGQSRGTDGYWKASDPSGCRVTAGCIRS